MGFVFKKLFTNMKTSSQIEQEKDIESFDINPRAQQLDLQWEKYFEQREAPTKDKLIQVDVGD